MAKRVNERRKAFNSVTSVSNIKVPKTTITHPGLQVQCEICSTVLAHRNSYRKHMKRQHSTDGIPHPSTGPYDIPRPHLIIEVPIDPV